MLLAAGRGERLRPATDHVPKALIEVGGVSLLERHLRRLADAGVTVAVINLGWLGEQIVERIGNGTQFGLQVAYSPEYTEILETGGGIQRALPLLGDAPFCVINADIVTDMPLTWPDLPPDVLGELVLVPNPPYRDHGDFAIEQGRVTNSDAATLTFSGVARYRPEFFAQCRPGRFSLAPLLREAADRGQLAGRLYEGLWADAGTPGRLAELNKRLSR